MNRDRILELATRITTLRAELSKAEKEFDAELGRAGASSQMYVPVPPSSAQPKQPESLPTSMKQSDQILHLMKRYPDDTFTPYFIGTKLHISPSSAGTALAQLVAGKKVVRIGWGQYKLKKS